MVTVVWVVIAYCATAVGPMRLPKIKIDAMIITLEGNFVILFFADWQAAKTGCSVIPNISISQQNNVRCGSLGQSICSGRDKIYRKQWLSIVIGNIPPHLIGHTGNCRYIDCLGLFWVELISLR